jgi:hypothetical protein
VKKDIVFETREGTVDISVVREFEKKIGFKFPKNYIDIITRYNEARIENYIETFYFYSNFMGRYDYCSLNHFLGYNTSGSTCSIEWYWRKVSEWYQIEGEDDDGEDYIFERLFPKNIIPFASDPAREKICFDYRHDPKTDNPKIVVWHAEEERGSSSELSFIASSFDEFLDMLYDDRTDKEKIYHEEVSWDNREISRKEALENQ